MYQSLYLVGGEDGVLQGEGAAGLLPHIKILQVFQSQTSRSARLSRRLVRRVVGRSVIISRKGVKCYFNASIGALVYTMGQQELRRAIDV